MNSTDDRPKLEVLTTLRFFAAALVVVFHCGQEAIQAMPWWIRGIAQNGFQTVSFFFVLSGFILAYNYLDPGQPAKLRVPIRQFWAARTARIYPMYALSLLIAFVPFTYSTFVAEITAPATYFGGLVLVPFLLQSWLPPLAWAWNMPAWALSVEAFLYAVFPLLVRGVCAFKSSRTALLAATLLTVLVSAVCHRVFPLSETGAPSASKGFAHHFFAFFPLVHLPVFLFGTALGRLFLERRRRGGVYGNWMFLVAGCAILLLFALHGRIAPIWLSSVVLVPLYGALIIGAANVAGWVAVVFSQRWLVALGERTCGIYILHVPLAFWFSRLWRKAAFLSEQSPLLFFICFAVFLLCFCAFAFKYLERPARRFVFERFGRQSTCL